MVIKVKVMKHLIRKRQPEYRRLLHYFFPEDAHKAHNRQFFGVVVSILALIFLSMLVLGKYLQFLTDPFVIREWLLSLGIWSGVFYVFIQFGQVILSAIPGQAFSIAGGFVFGVWTGTLYNLLGTMAGSVFVFWLTRTYGIELARSFIPGKEIIQLNRFFRRVGPLPLIIARLIPFFPNDMVSFFLGITDISYWRYTWTSFVGYLPQIIILNMLGAELTHGTPSFLMLILAILTTLMGLAYLFRQKLKRFLLREFKETEQEAEHLAWYIEKGSEETVEFIEDEFSSK